MKLLFSAAAVAAVALASAVAAETHITVDTTSGQKGDPIVIRAGYLYSESIPPNVYTIDSSGRLLHSGKPDVYVLDQPVTHGTYAGFFASLDETQLDPTSNFYASTGRLDGGDFRYEITSVTPIAGGAGTPGARFGFAAEEEGIESLSSAATRARRSYEIGVGNLYDDEQMLADRPGLYDVTVVAWDANGKYTDSAPVTFRIDVVPEPAAGALLGLAPLLVIGGPRRRETPT